MFSLEICKVCVHKYGCTLYYRRECPIQSKVFRNILKICDKPIDEICKACDEIFKGKLRWYSKVYILFNEGVPIKDISSICRKSLSATYAALHVAMDLTKSDSNFMAKVTMICSKLKESQ